MDIFDDFVKNTIFNLVLASTCIFELEFHVEEKHYI